jgi:4-hydroxybenzoate polyprenyltransferase
MIRQFLELVRFSHTVFALPFALAAAVLAWTAPTPSGTATSFEWKHLAGILAAMVCARTAAMAFNRLVDRRYDAANPRTASRHLPAGKLSQRSVVGLIGVAALGFVASTLVFLPNIIPLALAVPVLVIICGYSFAKRITVAAHWWLGAALALAPVAVWLALRGGIVVERPLDMTPAVVLGLAVMFWVGGFDVIYATLDTAFDRQAGLFSVPAWLGVRSALRVAAASHALMIVALALLGPAARWAGVPLDLGWVWALVVCATAVLLVAEHWLVRPDDLSRVNTAFFHVNAVVSFLVLGGIVVDQWLV